MLQCYADLSFHTYSSRVNCMILGKLLTYEIYFPNLKSGVKTTT
jgi:hypothetical protein